MTSNQRSKKESLQSVGAATITPTKRGRRKITLVTLLAVSLSIAIEVGFAATFPHGYASTTDSYKHSLCVTKVLDLSQKGVIRDAGGFNGAIYECAQMNSVNSIYGHVFSPSQQG